MEDKTLPRAENTPNDHLAERIRSEVKGLSEEELLCLCCRLMVHWQSDHGTLEDFNLSDIPLTAIIAVVHRDITNPEEVVQ